jgi:hypothetical protein
MASTSVAICDESPLLQSIGPTVIKKKRYWRLINKGGWKLNYPLFPVHKRSAPTRPQCRTRQWTKPNPDEKKKKNLPIDNIGPTKFIIYRWSKRKYVYLFTTAVQVASIFFHTFWNIKSRSIFANKLPDNGAESCWLFKQQRSIIRSHLIRDSRKEIY